MRATARLLVLVVSTAGVSVLLASCGPRMQRQVGLRPYKRALPPMPGNTVPRGGLSPLPTAESAVTLRNPLPATRENRALGVRYYGYYCAMCHAADGTGRSPVGESYDPRPTDLTSEMVQRLSDGQLYRAMLTGVGHEPVMSATVAADRRWPIVAHLRTLKPR